LASSAGAVSAGGSSTFCSSYYTSGSGSATGVAYIGTS